MDEKLIEARYDVTKKTKIKKFYESNKILILCTIFFFIILIAFIIFYSESKERKKISLSENYITAKIYLSNEERNKAKDILENIIFANDNTYSALSLFLILNEKLITDQQELSNLFDHVLKNNKFDKEIKNLLIFKKALFQSNFVSEHELLNSIKPLLNTDTLWKPHALLLLGDYFVSKKEYSKATEFYTQILSLKNLNEGLYEQARTQLRFITNE
jgi:predicted negative regulator of RcsB-dependent stress response